MKNLFFYLLFFSLSIEAVAATASNCQNDEQIIFSCASEKKTISLCASPSKSNDSYLDYRFSQNGKSSFSYRSDESSIGHIFMRTQVSGASSSSTIIWFENEGYTYILNEPVKGYPFISVRQSKKEISRIQCTADFDGDSNIANPYIQEKKNDDYFRLLH
jgi:hypothetical protein